MEFTTLSTSELTATFLSIALLLLAAMACGTLFEKFGAPRVVGEITGGLLLGGTCFYHFCPELANSIFKAFAEQDKVLNVIYQFGLVFLMFSSGFNTRIEVDRKNARLISLLFIGATVFPMAMGYVVSPYFTQYFLGDAGNRAAFLIVFMISIAITSIPVISKIFFDLGLMNTKFSNTVLTTSTLQDLCLWIMLNLAISLVSYETTKVSDMLVTVAVTIGLFVLVRFLSAGLHRVKIKMAASTFCSLAIVILFLFITVLNHLKINLMYSAFIAGYAVKAVAEANPKAAEKIPVVSDFAFAFFIPVYFALVGLQLNLLHNFSLWRFCVFFVVAFVLEFVGCFVMLLFTNLKKQSVINFSIIMNARGGPGIVLATVGYYHKIISVEFFTVLIMTTMISSLLAGYWLRYQKKKDILIFTEMERP